MLTGDAFQFTHPGRGATYDDALLPILREVSIHAPREGCDYMQNQLIASQVEFQFTHPGRGATVMHRCNAIVPVCFNSRTPGGVRQQWHNYI